MQFNSEKSLKLARKALQNAGSRDNFLKGSYKDSFGRIVINSKVFKND